MATGYKCDIIGSLTSADYVRNPLGWAWQDFSSPGGTSLTLTANENGTDVEFEAARVVSNTAVIVKQSDPDTFVYSGTTPLFSTKIVVDSHTGTSVTLNDVPNAVWGDVRVYYLYNYSCLPEDYTLAPKFIRDTNIVELDNLFITEEEFNAYFPISHNNTSHIIDTGIKTHTQIDNHINDTLTNPHNVPNAVVELNVTCDSSVSLGDWVYMDSGTAKQAIATSLQTSMVRGVCVNKSSSTNCDIKVAGVTTGIYAGLDDTKPYFLSSSTPGAMTVTPVTGSGNFLVNLGQPFNTTKFSIIIAKPIGRS